MNSKNFISLLLTLVLVSCSNTSSQTPVAPVSTPEATVTPTLMPEATATSPGLSSNIVQAAGESVLLDYALSPDGKSLAIYVNAGIFIYTLDTMQKMTLMEFDDTNYSRFRSGAVAFSPDGGKVAFSGKFAGEDIVIWEIKSKTSVDVIRGLPDKYYVTEIEFSPDGKDILVRNTNNEAMHCEGYGIDRLILYAVRGSTILFQTEKCVIYPPLQFTFSDNNRLFLYAGSMSPEYAIYLVDTNTGEIVLQKKLDWGKDGNFYTISPDGEYFLVETAENGKRITQLVNLFSGEVMGSVEGKIKILHGENGYVVKSYNANSDWFFWEGNKIKCSFNGIQLSPEIKTSMNRELFAVEESETRLQIWKVSTCEIIGELQFDKIRW